jgi:hypothetical protein
MFQSIESEGLESLVIDMRFNGGGNTDIVQPLIHGLIRCDRVNRPGHLFVIIGRHTFSAAQNTVNMIEINTNAAFVGEPTGSRPNFVGESTFFVLPYSRLKVHCSSRYWQYASSIDQRTWVQPQIAAEMTCADICAGRDPCVEAVMRAIEARTKTEGVGSETKGSEPAFGPASRPGRSDSRRHSSSLHVREDAGVHLVDPHSTVLRLGGGRSAAGDAAKEVRRPFGALRWSGRRFPE